MPSRPDPDASPSPPPPRRGPDARVWVTNPARSGFVWWLLRYYLYLGAALLVVLGGVGVTTYREFAADLPDLETIERYSALAPGVTRIHAEGGAMLAELAREHRAYARYEDVPETLVHAFLAAEDRRFFEHEGLDYRGLARALVANLRAGTVSQGGSTITQQVAKGFLSHEQTLARKLREAILSVRMESRLPKERILEIYLNKIFLGHGAYGVAAAASRYFDKKLHELTLAESALIAGMARAPSRYSPFSSVERAQARRSVVLQTMVEAGYITPDERDTADAEPIELARVPDVFRARAPYYAEAARLQAVQLLGEDTVLQDGLLIETPVDLLVQRMAERSVDRALRKIDRRQGWRGPEAHLQGDTARETLRQRIVAHYGAEPLEDPSRWVLGLVTKVNKYNAWLEVGDTKAVLPLGGAEWAAPYDRNTGVNDVKTSDLRKVLEPGDVVWVRRVANPRKTPEDDDPLEVELGQLPRVEAALYTLDHQTGYVVAMQGGHDYDRSQFNRPIQGCRQPGSVFKAIYYAYALDTGDYAMDSMLEDRPYEPEPGEAWNPQNIHGTLEGKVLLRNAFIHSLNLPSIRLFQRLGAKNVVQWARRLGFTTELIADKALSLGASCVRTDELSRAFGIFVRGGRWFDPVYIRRITNKRGEVVVDHRHPFDGAMDVAGRIDALGRAAVEPPYQAVDPRTAFLITKMMRDVVAHGIGRRAGRIGVEAGGKSGTASKHEYTTDTWFVGFTSRFVTASWMGDDNYERSLGNEDASYTTATPMWADYMGEVVADVPHGELTPHRPRGVRSRSVDFQQGAQLRSAVLWFR
jgi:penicillin-binding protein 1A